MCKPFIEIDYPCSDIFVEYQEELQGKIFPFTPFNWNPLNDTDLEDHRILDTLEAMGLIRTFKDRCTKDERT